MAHFAQIDENNVVTQVIVVNNEELLQDGVENPVKGARFCQDLFGGNWLQTSYNGNIRKNFAGIGYTFDFKRNAFIPPKTNCHPTEVLDEATCLWTCPDPSHVIIQGE